jgi:pimeloyl-ACP methyl ester carboxylesterase
VPDLQLVRVPGASHRIIHERPAFIAAEIDKHLAR